MSRQQNSVAWWFSIVFHGVVIGAVAFLIPTIVIKDSFEPPLRFEQRIESTELVLPRWQSQAEMPPMPEMQVVFEPVQEHEVIDNQKLSDHEINFISDIDPSRACPVCAIGQMTRPRVKHVTSKPLVAVSEPSVQVPREEPVSKAGVRSACVIGVLKPRYPERQRVAGKSATVLLLIHINEQGRPEDVKLLSDDVHVDFAKAAIAAVFNAQYEPAMTEGKPISSMIRVRVQFQLQ